MNCPHCDKPLLPGQDTARIRQVVYHAGCAEDRLMTELEDAGLQEVEA